MKEWNGIYYGANIYGGEGGVVCDDLGNDSHYTLAEVNADGAVVTDDDGRFQRLTLADYKEDGVQVLRGVNDNPIVAPGKHLEVSVGRYALMITGTKEKGVVFNRKPPTKVTKRIERVRYPR